MKKTICPNCGSRNVRLRPIAIRTCSSIGAVTGGIAAAKTGVAGAEIGGALMPRYGTVIGGVTGFLTGFLAGALSGAAVGYEIDRKIIQAYHCDSCGHDFVA